MGWIYGTSAGALSGTMAATDRLDQLEEFLIALRPEEVFRPHALWQLPLTGLHDYTLPETIAARVAPLETLAAELATAPIELVVCVTEVAPVDVDGDEHAFERVYSSRQHAAFGDGCRRARVGGDQRARPARPRRRDDRHRRRLGAQLPARARLRQPDVREILAFRHVSRTRAHAARTWPGSVAAWSRSEPSLRYAR